MDNFDLKKYLAENKLFGEIQKIELNTSFLQTHDDFERGGDEGYTVWKPEFKNGIKANQQNFKSSSKPAIPAQRIKFEMVDMDGEQIPYINVKFKNL
jgi:hypothetical protein